MLKLLIYLLVVTITTITLCVEPLAAFDTFWHSAATGAVSREYHFSDDVNNILQFGNFSGPDFFGPFYDTVLGERVEGQQQRVQQWLDSWEEFLKSEANITTLPSNPQQLQNYTAAQNIYKIRKSAIFLHFDNINGKLDSNAKFDYLFDRLLKNTQTTLDTFYASGDMNEGTKKLAILMTLGGSLHMVQDFYSHSDWTHNDFPTLGMPLVQTSWGKQRAPTWFEVRAKLGDPAHWPFKVKSGKYPPVPPSPYTHTHMNHDNSQLFYPDNSKPGKPVESQLSYHEAGAFPASKSASEHQIFAVNTAAGASIEWVALVEKDAQAKAAIDYSKDWDLKKFNPMMLHDLENCLTLTLIMSCAVNKWDGNNPPPARASTCRAVMGGVGGTGAAAASGAIAIGGPALGGFVGGASTVGLGIGIPLAAMFANEFWAIQTKYNLCERLSKGFASPTGDYVLPN